MNNNVKRCSFCGTVVAIDSMKCPICGKKIESKLNINNSDNGSTSLIADIIQEELNDNLDMNQVESSIPEESNRREVEKHNAPLSKGESIAEKSFLCLMIFLDLIFFILAVISEHIPNILPKFILTLKINTYLFWEIVAIDYFICVLGVMFCPNSKLLHYIFSLFVKATIAGMIFLAILLFLISLIPPDFH